MNISDILYFAPGIPFKDVDWEGGKLPDQFHARIEGFYLEPAECRIETEHAFAAGLLLVSCVDALARLKYRSNNVGQRFKKYLTKDLKDFKGALAQRFYDEVGNGLVHEARPKNGAQFTLDSFINKTLDERGDILLANRKYLIAEVREALRTCIELLKKDEHELRLLSASLMLDLEKDIRSAAQFGG